MVQLCDITGYPLAYRKSNQIGVIYVVNGLLGNAGILWFVPQYIYILLQSLKTCAT